MKRRSFLTGGASLGLAAAMKELPVLAAAAMDPDQVSTVGRMPVRSRTEFDAAGGGLGNAVIKGLDLRDLSLEFWDTTQMDNAFFLGCEFASTSVEQLLRARGAALMPKIDGLAYDPFRNALYSPDEIVAKTEYGTTVDHEIYANYVAEGKGSPNLLEALSRRIHDYSMDDALGQLGAELEQTKMVCITGGFFQDRTDPWFRRTAEMARLLSLDNKFVVTGGGPGIMEAANLGAYMAAYDRAALDAALEMLARAPEWTNPQWQICAGEVLERFPDGNRSLGIPTWFYGFEPTNLFATDIAKYFDNNIREGVLMSISKGGAVFAPGAAGARQEIFMVATQNHFGSSGYFYPIVLFGKQHYEVETHVYQLLKQVANDNFRDLVHSTDDPAEVVRFIAEHPPVASKQADH